MDGVAVHRVREMVEVDNEIVTYKTLSRILQLPTAIAKQVLHDYVYKCRSESIPISVVYALSGISTHDEHVLTLVADDELEEAKRSLVTVKGFHVYSVSRSKIKCSDQLSAINYTVLHSGLQSHAYWNSISCDEAPGCSEHVLATDCHKPSDKVKAATNHKSSSGKETSLPRLSFMPPEDEQPQQQLDKQYASEAVMEERKDKTKESVSIKTSKRSPHKSPRKRGRPPKVQHWMYCITSAAEMVWFMRLLPDSPGKQTSILNFFKATI